MPILGSLELLARAAEAGELSGAAGGCGGTGEDGRVDLGAFEAQGGFPLVYTTTLLAGERSGNLEEVLQRFLDFQRVQLTFRKKLKASLIYPALLIVMVIGLFIFLITFVVPRFAQLYDQLGTHLPGLTAFLLDLGRGGPDTTGSMRRLLAVAVIFLISRWTKTDAGATSSTRCGWRYRVFGNVWLKYQVGLFSRTLSTLLTGGLPLVPSLETAAKSIDSRQIGTGGASVGGDGERGQGSVAPACRRRRCFRSWRSR